MAPEERRAKHLAVGGVCWCLLLLATVLVLLRLPPLASAGNSEEQPQPQPQQLKQTASSKSGIICADESKCDYSIQNPDLTLIKASAGELGELGKSDSQHSQPQPSPSPPPPPQQQQQLDSSAASTAKSDDHGQASSPPETGAPLPASETPLPPITKSQPNSAALEGGLNASKLSSATPEGCTTSSPQDDLLLKASTGDANLTKKSGELEHRAAAVPEPEPIAAAKGDASGEEIIRMKVAASSPTKDMLSFEEWRKKISEQMEQKQLQQQRDLNLLNQQQQQLLQDSQASQGEPSSALKTPSAASISTGNLGNGNTGNGRPVSTATGAPQMLPTNRARNFASHECGAKIVDSNSEADFVNRVLNEQTDEYMLNPCKTANWFVIELCETIQPAYLEMANFELYSSIPREFSVAASEHYPAREPAGWSVLGSFTAADVRSVQGFKLANNGFVKYLRVQLHSYYGAEHFCPVSVLRVYGTSLFDEVERIDKPLEADSLAAPIVDASSAAPKTVIPAVKREEEEGSSIAEEPASSSTATTTSTPPATPPPSTSTISIPQATPTTTTGDQQQHPNLFGSAKNAVYSIVMRALNSNIFHRILDNFSLVNGSASSKDEATVASREDGSAEGGGSGTEELGGSHHAQPRSNTFNVHDQSVVIRLYSRYKPYLDACETFFSTTSGSAQLLTLNQSHCTLHIPRQCIYLRYLLFPVDEKQRLKGGNAFNADLFDLLYTQYVIRRYINGGLLFQCAFNRTYGQLNATGLSLLIANAKLQQQLNGGKAGKGEGGSRSSLHSEETSARSAVSSVNNLSADDSHHHHHQQLVHMVEEGALQQQQHRHQTITSSSLVDQIINSSGGGGSVSTSVLPEVISSSSILLIPESLNAASGDDQLKYNFTTAADAVVAASIESSLIAPTVVQPLISTHQLPASATISVADAAAASVVLTPLDSSSSLMATTEQTSSSLVAEVKKPPVDSASATISAAESSSSPSSSASASQQTPSSSSSQSIPPLPPQPPIIESYQTGEASSLPSPSGEVLSSSSGQSKEAVIIRLTNRIKHLEKNISLMSTYLESLSVRYRNQMEEMQLIFNRTIEHLNNTAIRAAEKDAKQQENILTLESEISQLKATIEEVRTGAAFTDLPAWLAANRDHLALMAAELLLVLLISCLVLTRRAHPISTSHVAISHAEHLLLQSAQLAGVNVKKSLHRSKSLSDLPDEDQQQAQPPSPNLPSDRSCRIEEEKKEKPAVEGGGSSCISKSATEHPQFCDTAAAAAVKANATAAEPSVSSSSNKENCLGVCGTNGPLVANGTGPTSTPTAALLGNGIQRLLFAKKKSILNESNR